MPLFFKAHAFSANRQKLSAPEATLAANIFSPYVRAAKLVASESVRTRILMGTDNAALNRCHARSSLDSLSASHMAAYHVSTTERPAIMTRGSVMQTAGLPGSRGWAT